MEIIFLETQNGKRPVAEFILNRKLVSKTIHKKIVNILDILEQKGGNFLIYSTKFKKMSGYGKYNICEIKIKKYRIMCHLENNTLYLVHAFIKKTPKTPKKEIEITINRINNYIFNQ